MLLGLKFYTKNGAVVLKTAYNWLADGDWCKTHTVLLEDGERVIGYRSRSDPFYADRAWHFDF